MKRQFETKKSHKKTDNTQQHLILSRVKSENNLALSEIDTETCSDTPRIKSVKFIQNVTDRPLSIKHRSSSIIKQSQFIIKKGRFLTRSQSVNSLMGQNPQKDDQTCQNAAFNKNIQQQYSSLMRQYERRGNYQDEIFPHVNSSIFHKEKEETKNIKWMRISNVFPKYSLNLWGTDPGKTKIIGSELVSEYFILGMNCLKYSKNLLRIIFQSQQVNRQGVYCLKIFHGNIWKYIIIDDYIPVIQAPQIKNGLGYRPAFISIAFNPNNQTESLQIWPFLLQKAFAKLYSSYQALQKGNIYDFLEQLTNCPYQFIDLKQGYDLEPVFKSLYNVAFGETHQCQKIALQLGIGQSTKLSFTKNSNNQRKIIEIDELPKYFKEIYIFYSHHKYQYKGYTPIKQTKQSISVRTFSITDKTTPYSITLYQKDEKYFKTGQYEYSWIRLVLAQKQYGGYRWIDARYENYKSLSLNGQLQPGQYVLIILPQWSKKPFQLNLILRCQIPVCINRIPYKVGMFQDICADLAQRFGVLNQINKQICSYNCIHEDMGLIIENFNNERQKGMVRIIKTINCSDQHISKSNAKEIRRKLQPFNQQFKKSLKQQITIKGGQYYTLILMTKQGVDSKALQIYKFTV